jgi:tRNA A22 N-methylase
VTKSKDIYTMRQALTTLALLPIARCSFYSFQRGHKALPCTISQRCLWQRPPAVAATQQKEEDPISLAETALMTLGRQGKSWQRLQHLVYLAGAGDDRQTKIRGATDVGTDHGLLAVGLAVSGLFDRVVGIDVSKRALEDGAMRLKEQIEEYRKNNNYTTRHLNLDFRHGDGLKEAKPGEADVVCIAGMGVNTMINILSATTASSEDDHRLLLDYLGCQQLILQPTNSRPRHLMLLYDRLRGMGWRVEDERIEYMSSRWYISTLFVRNCMTPETTLPGAILNQLERDDPAMWKVFLEYVKHHCSWVRKDMKNAGGVREEDDTWLRAFDGVHTERPKE